MNKFMIWLIKGFVKQPCENCGAKNADFCIDPYDKDIDGTIRYCWLCNKCWQDRTDEI